MTTLSCRRTALCAVLLVVIGTACGGDSSEPIRLYTSVTEATVTAIVDQFVADTGREVEVFRAPTGELTARIAAEEREGGIQADVLWLTDPLSMDQYAADGLLESWQPEGAEAIDAAHQTEFFWGTRLLSMVIVHRPDLEPLTSWHDLATRDFTNPISAPDPGFAGSAFAVLGFFAAEPDFGVEFYRELRDNGLVVVNAPGEVVSGVAEGRFDAGITLEFSARTAAERGSPVSVVWPAPGAIAIYSPIGVVEGGPDAARDFTEWVLTPQAQQLIADTGWQPIRTDVPWDVGGPQLPVDWSALFDSRDDLLATYQSILDE